MCIAWPCCLLAAGAVGSASGTGWRAQRRAQQLLQCPLTSVCTLAARVRACRRGPSSQRAPEHFCAQRKPVLAVLRKRIVAEQRLHCCRVVPRRGAAAVATASGCCSLVRRGCSESDAVWAARCRCMTSSWVRRHGTGGGGRQRRLQAMRHAQKGGRSMQHNRIKALEHVCSCSTSAWQEMECIASGGWMHCHVAGRNWCMHVSARTFTNHS